MPFLPHSKYNLRYTHTCVHLTLFNYCAIFNARGCPGFDWYGSRYRLQVERPSPKLGKTINCQQKCQLQLRLSCVIAWNRSAALRNGFRVANRAGLTAVFGDGQARLPEYGRAARCLAKPASTIQ